MRKTTVPVVPVCAAVTASALALGVGTFVPRVSAQAASYHVLTVTNGGFTCRDLTSNLRTDRDTWRTVYYNCAARPEKQIQRGLTDP